MKVILLKDIPLLGQKSDVKDIKDGYARNFLLPRKLAIAATPVLIAETELQKAARKQQKELNLQETKNLVKKLAHMRIDIAAKASEEGSLYAGVGFGEIRVELAKQHIDISTARMKDEMHIKKVGEHSVTLQFPYNLEAEIVVSISPDN